MDEWRDISGYEGCYQIDNKGKVKSLSRTLSFLEKILNPEHTQGYRRVTLSKKGEKRRYMVHRLVAIAFIPNPENKPCVNHKDGNKSNNCVDNLEWVTHSENEIHSFYVLGKKVFYTDERRKKISKAHKGKKLTPQHIAKLCKPKSNKENYPRKRVILNNQHIFESVSGAARQMGILQTSISNNLLKKTKTTKVGIWEYYQM